MEEKLKTLLSVLLGVDEGVIDENASSETIEEWDSLKQMNIIVAIEEEFNVQFDEEQSILSNSYQSLLKLLNKKQNKKKTI